MQSPHITMMTIATQAAYDRAVIEARHEEATYFDYCRHPGRYSKAETETVIHDYHDACQRLADIEFFAETH